VKNKTYNLKYKFLFSIFQEKSHDKRGQKMSTLHPRMLGAKVCQQTA